MAPRKRFHLETNRGKRTEIRRTLSYFRPNHKGWITASIPPPNLKESFRPTNRVYFEARPGEGRCAAVELGVPTLYQLLNLGIDNVELRSNVSTSTKDEKSPDIPEQEGPSPPITRAMAQEVEERRKRLKEEAGLPSDNDDVWMRLLVPVFCTANIPSEMLDDFLTAPSESGRDFEGQAGFVVLSNASTDNITTTSRAPAQPPRPNPFLNKTPKDIHGIFTSSIRPPDNRRSFWTSFTFVILDSRTLEDRSVLLCTDHHDYADEPLETVRSDFQTSLWHLWPLELCEMTVEEVAWMRDEGTDVLTEGAAKREDTFMDAMTKFNREEGEEPETYNLEKRDSKELGIVTPEGRLIPGHALDIPEGRNSKSNRD